MKFSKWTAAPAEIEAPRVRKVFVSGGGTGKLRITGLGFFEIWLNGEPLDRKLFQPVWSDYEERKLDNLLYPLSDRFTHRIYYLEYDVSLLQGENVLCVLLGNGWYRQNMRNIEGNLAYGDRLKLAFELSRPDGTVLVSDGSLRVSASGILSSNLYFGEVQDASKMAEDWLLPDFDDSDWGKMAEIAAPDAELTLQACPADVVRRVWSPVLAESCGERKIWDAGVNFSGRIRLRGKGRVELRFSEELTPDGELDFASAGGADQIAADVFENLTPAAEAFPRFVWHAFRYFETRGEVVSLVCEEIGTEARVLADFRADGSNAEWFFHAYLQTQLSNMHAGVPSDCPHRERLGYTGDGQLISASAMLMLDSKLFFEKWMRDVADCQDLDSGHVQHTAPFYGGGGGPGGWGSAIVLVPWRHYQQYGERNILESYFPNMLRWVESMEGFSEENLVVREREKGWCLGDWCSFGELPPEPFVNTCLYVRALECCREIARILDEDGDAGGTDVVRGGSSDAFRHFRRFDSMIAAKRRALIEAYYDPSSRKFRGPWDMDLFAYAAGIADVAAKRRIVSRIEAHPVIETGIFGTDLLFEFLDAEGREDLIWRLFESGDVPSFGAMNRRGATTLWEDWRGENSHSHPMFGACARFLFLSVLGIRPLEPGWKRVRIVPVLTEILRSGSLELPAGRVEVEYLPQRKIRIRLDGVCGELLEDGQVRSLEPGESLIDLR